MQYRSIYSGPEVDQILSSVKNRLDNDEAAQIKTDALAAEAAAASSATASANSATSAANSLGQLNNQVTLAAASATASANSATASANSATASAASATSAANQVSIIANGTATDAGTLTGSEIVPMNRSAGLLQTTLTKIGAWVISTYTGFTQLGTGAIARTVLGKLLGLSIDVLDYGADPTSNADSTAAFQAALNQQAATGKTIIIPAGQYKINGQLTYYAPLKWTGEGMDSSKVYFKFIGGPSLIPSGTNAHMPGTCVEKLSLIGPNSVTGTGEYFYQSQTFEANRNGIFRDLHLQYWDRCGFVITDSYDNFFSNIRFWNIGNTTTYGWGILHDRVTWSASNGYASTGNHYENISCMHIYRGIGVTPGNQIIEGHFYRITGEFCDGTVETYAGTAPTGGWAGTNSFVGTYSEMNTSFGIKSPNGTEIECYSATYSGSGNNQSNYSGAYVKTLNGVLSIGNNTSGGFAAMKLMNTSGTTGSTFQYNTGLSKTQILSSNGTSIFSVYDGIAGGGSSYVQIADAANTSYARQYWGVGTNAYIDFGVSNTSAFTFNGTSYFNNNVTFKGTHTVTNAANPQTVYSSTSGTTFYAGVNGTTQGFVLYDQVGAITLATFYSVAGGNKITLSVPTTISGAATLSSTMSVAGAATFSSSVTVSGITNPSTTYNSSSGTNMNVGVNGAAGAVLVYDNVGTASVVKFNSVANGGKASLNYGLIVSKSGANPSMGTATLVAGTVTVNTTAVNANCKILLTMNTPGGTVGYQYAKTADIVSGTSFKITSTSNTDTSTVNWFVIEGF